jgi:hypothetical protein
MSRSKIILLDERFEKTGEPTVQTILLWTPLRGKPSWERLTKEACASPALEYIRNIQPTPGRTVVLVIGLGSYEYYGLNRNGDGFNEVPYKPGKSNGPGRDAWVMEPECIQHHFHSYEQGHVFRHHVNRDPVRAVGRVLKAFWNPFMHRVEVLEDIDNAKAADLVQQIADGEFPAKSMGCRIAFDVCTNCGNMAPTRKHYCDCLKWQLNWLDPKTGIRYGALNPSPRFFDSSWVVRPADRTGYLLQKVAERTYELRSSSELGDLVDALNAKSAAAKKLAVIDKVVRGYPAGVVSSDTVPEASLIQRYRDTSLPDVVARTPELGAADIGMLAQHRLPDVLAALSRSGIILTTPEFLRLFLAKAAPGVTIPDDVLDRAAALQAEVFELLGQHPSLVDDMAPSLTDAQPEAVAKISAALTPLLEKRATMGDYLWRRIRPRAFIPHDAPPTTDMLTVEDPTTGAVYQTTRGAGLHAQNALDETHLKRLLGAGALMAGAGKVLTAVPGAGKALALPLAGAGLYLGQTGLQQPASYTTTTGERVPVITEFAERDKQSSLMPLVDTLGIEHQLTKKGAERVWRALYRTSTDHPAHLFLQKQAQLGFQYGQLSLANVLAAQDKLASDGITEEKIDLDKAAALVGALLWPDP